MSSSLSWWLVLRCTGLVWGCSLSGLARSWIVELRKRLCLLHRWSRAGLQRFQWRSCLRRYQIIQGGNTEEWILLFRLERAPLQRLHRWFMMHYPNQEDRCCLPSFPWWRVAGVLASLPGWFGMQGLMGRTQSLLWKKLLSLRAKGFSGSKRRACSWTIAAKSLKPGYASSYFSTSCTTRFSILNEWSLASSQRWGQSRWSSSRNRALEGSRIDYSRHQHKQI